MENDAEDASVVQLMNIQQEGHPARLGVSVTLPNQRSLEDALRAAADALGEIVVAQHKVMKELLERVNTNDEAYIPMQAMVQLLEPTP
jgi:hypothetical protein